MIKAERLIQLLTNNHTKPLAGKYVKIVLQIATLEERIRAFIAIGLIDRSNKLNKQLTTLIRQIKRDFKNEQLGNDGKGN